MTALQLVLKPVYWKIKELKDNLEIIFTRHTKKSELDLEALGG